MAAAAAASPTTKPREIKVVFLGDTAVGKTAILSRYLNNRFDTNHEVTVALDFVVKELESNGKKLVIQFWDTAGQERFQAQSAQYLRDSSGVVVVYDITNRKSFEAAQKWVNDARSIVGNDVQVLLAANKIDLEAQRKVTTDEGNKLAIELHTLFIEVSAKDNRNIKELFDKLIAAIPESVPKPANPRDNLKTVTLTSSQGSGSQAAQGAGTSAPKKDEAGICAKCLLM